MRSNQHRFAAILLLCAAAFAFAAPARADTREEQRQEADTVRETPIVGYSLMDAVYARHGGRCRWRLNYLRRATEDLEFYKRYLRANPGTDKVSQQDIDRAQRALDREKRQPCNPSTEDQQFQTDLAASPPLTGAVEPMPSQYSSGGNIQERHLETRAALDDIFRDESKCQVELARRWLENHRRLLAELRMRRDAALAAGEMSTVDAAAAHGAVMTMRSILEVAEDRFHRYRIDCSKRTRTSRLESGCGDRPAGSACDQGFTVPRCTEESGDSGCEWRAQPECTEGTEPGCDFEPRCYENDNGGCDYRLPEQDFEFPEPVKQAAIQFGVPGVLFGMVQSPSDDEQAMLDVHNEARHDFGVPPLLWDAGLAASAAEYAKVIAETGQLVHAPREGREHERENLLATNIGYRSPAEMIEVMVAEKQYYKPGIYPDISTTGDWYPVGHYTQIVWPWTTHVGCAIESGEFFEYTVCRYTPPGNRDGDPLVPGGNGWEQAATD